MSLQLTVLGEYFYCFVCKVPVQMVEYREMRCPNCGECESDAQPKKVLCCVECEKPLKVTPRRGSYCDNCNYAPTAQDLIFRKIESLPPNP